MYKRLKAKALEVEASRDKAFDTEVEFRQIAEEFESIGKLESLAEIQHKFYKNQAVVDLQYYNR